MKDIFKSKKVILLALAIVLIVLSAGLFIYYKLNNKTYNDEVLDQEQSDSDYIITSVDTALKSYIDEQDIKKGVTIAVIDSGVNTENNEEVENRLVDGYNFTDEEDMSDGYIHGTFVSRLITQETDDNIKIMPIKVADSDGNMDIESIAKAVNFAIDNGVDVINLSISVMQDSSDELYKALQLADEKGIYVMMSAGNKGSYIEANRYSDLQHIYVVGALNDDNTYAEYSNYGSGVDICAYGTYNAYDGTSYATARVSAIVASLIERNISDISKILRDYSIDVKNYNSQNGNEYGYIGTAINQVSGTKKEQNNYNLKYDILFWDWKSLETEELDKYLAGTESQYVGMFLKNLSEEDMKLLEEKSNVLHSETELQDYEASEDDELTLVATDTRIVDFAEFCISKYEESNNSLELSMGGYAIGKDDVGTFYIAEDDGNLLIMYQLWGFQGKFQNNKGTNTIVDKLTAKPTIVNKNNPKFTIPKLDSIKYYTTDIQAHKVVWTNTKTTEMITENHPEYITSRGDTGAVYYGISLNFINFKAPDGYRVNESNVSTYRYGSKRNEKSYSYSHLYNTNNIFYMDLGYEDGYYIPNKADCMKLESQTNFKYGSEWNVQYFYDYDNNKYDKLETIVRLTDTSSFNNSAGTMQLNSPVMYFSGTTWVSQYTGNIMMENDITEFVFSATRNNYTIVYDCNGKAGGTGSISSTTIHKNDNFTLSDGTGFSNSGKSLDHWAVIRQSDNAVFCKDDKWHVYGGSDSYANNSANWRTYAKSSTYKMDNAWINANCNGDDTFIFVAQWKDDPTPVTPPTPKTQTGDVFVIYDKNGADGGSSYIRSYSYDGAKGQTYDKCGFSKTGYTFNSWNASSTGESTTYKTTDKITGLESSKGNTRIKAYTTGLALDLKNADTTGGEEKSNIGSYKPTGLEAQDWTIQYGGDDKKINGVPYYAIIYTNSETKKALDIKVPVANNANVQLWDYNRTDNQLWRIEYVGGGCVRFHSKADDSLCLAVRDNSDGENTNVWVSNGTSDKQKWYIEGACRTVYAKWAPETYTFTIDPNGGQMYHYNGTGLTSSKVSKNFTYNKEMRFSSYNTYTGKDLKICGRPSKQGYDFDGWEFTQGSGTITYDNYWWHDSQWNIDLKTYNFKGDNAGDVTVKAKWKKKSYTVTIKHYIMNTSGEYPSSPNSTSTIGNQLYETILNNEDYKDKSLLVQNGIEYDKEKTGDTTKVTGDTIIKLYYKRIKHTAIFNVSGNGGTWSDNNSTDKEVQIYYDAKIPLDKYKAIKADGFSFIGWNKDKDTEQVLQQAKMGTSDVTFYAIYKKTLTATFTDSKGTTTRSVDIYNNQTKGRVGVPKISSYTGWTDNEVQLYDDEKNSIDEKKEITSEYNIVGYSSVTDINKDNAINAEIGVNENTIILTQDRNYYAVYSSKVKLVYVLNGGIANNTTKDINDTVYCNAYNLELIREKKVNLAQCVKPEYDENGYIHSYKFVVWTENTIDGARFSQNSEYVLKKNTIMHAVWDEKISPIEYDIEFDGNAGNAVKNVPDTIHTKYDEQVTIPATIPERTAFKFLGWNTRRNGDGIMYQPLDKVSNLTTIRDDTVKLYAQWQKKKIRVVKTASTWYNDTIVRRTEGDEDWYNSIGRLTIDEIVDYKDEDCKQIWHIDNRGNITRLK